MSALILTVLGCDGSHAGAGGAASGYLLRDFAHGTSIWIDSGPGTFANLQTFTDPTTLSAIVLTHEHGDHWADLEGFVTAARWTMDFHRDPVPVFAAPGIRSRLAQDTDGVLDWREIGDGDGADVGGLSLRFSRTEHPAYTLAVRVDGEGTSLGYSADSGPGWSMEALGGDIDLALHEATFTDDLQDSEGIHMSGTQAGRSARAARARRLVVTHRWAKVSAQAVLEEARASFGGVVLTAATGRGFNL